MTTSSSSLPKVALIGTGGTIAGVAPTPLEQISYQAGVLTVDRMLETLPGIEGVARITSVQCGNLPSENITPQHWAMLGEQCAKTLQDPEICGAVLTHGTDTLEESAFYLYLTLASPKPVVLTGSMRPATSLSADGPINIRDSVAVAACPQAQARGALLVMNSRVLSARTAVKVATLDVEAFRALESGCLGRVINGEPQFYYGGEANPVLAGTFAQQAGRSNLPRVDVIYGCAGMPVDLVRYSIERSAGIVLAGMGNGSMPDAVRHELRQAGVHLWSEVQYLAIDDDGLHLLHGGTQKIVPADQIILCAGQAANDELASLLSLSGRPVHCIGGACSARHMDARLAILQGTELALRI